MRTLLQYLALCLALALLAVGANRMHTAPLPPEPVAAPVTTALQDPETTVAAQAETVWIPSLEDEAATQDMTATYVFAYDVEGKEMVLCTTRETERLYPASITKLFTAWVALRFLSPDEEVKAGWELGFLQPGSSVAAIALDSRMTVEMLIEGMLLPSGNDAALVLAAAAGRRILGQTNATASDAVAAFVAEMNRAAEALELENSHFVNPDGYHSEDHYSCPADLARIGVLALEEPVMRRCMRLPQDTVTFPSGQTHSWKNTNRLLDPESECYCPDAVGMKTGYTGSAGYCLMAAFGEERPLVVGIFGCTDSVSRYEDARELYQLWRELTE